MSLHRLIALVLVLGLLLTLGAFPLTTTHAGRSLPGNLVVNDLSDTLHSPGCATKGTGKCSLRDAITYANASSDENSITFSKGGMITLGSLLPSVSATLTIDGGGIITLAGAGNYQVLSINYSATATLKNLAIT